MVSQTPKAEPKKDLGLRLASAAVLIPVALFVVFQGGAWLATACGLFAAIMAYEWVRMTASPSMKIFVTLAILPFIPAILGEQLWAVWTLFACVFLASLIHPNGEKRGAEAFGLLYVCGMSLALYVLREGPWDGVAAALIVMGIVWGSDSAAYFTGRTLGGPLLHPDSPSKTWSGAIGAVVFSSLCGALAAYLTDGHLFVWVTMGAIISILAQVGDLMESSMKRSYGVKDSGGVMPGHGGLLDRVDGLGLVCAVIATLFLFVPLLTRALGLAG